MTPAFLHEVAARQIYANDETFMELWEEKARLAQGYAFQADVDIYNTALDVIFATSFGLNVKDSNSTAQLQQLRIAKVTVPSSPDDPLIFPHTQRPVIFDAISTLTQSLETTIKAPFPRFAHWVLRQMPYMRKARAAKEALFTEMIDVSVKRVTSGNETTFSALDDILLRETAAAKKENRSPVYYSRTVYDEVTNSSSYNA